MKITESEFVKRTVELFRRGHVNGWLGMVGDSISRWLTSRELMACESELRWDGAYRPIGFCAPRLARECFLVCRRNDAGFGLAGDNSDAGLMVIQVNDRGDMFRTLWENYPNNYPPLELNIHFTVHQARSAGAGEVVYHCQPIRTLALAGMTGADGRAFMEELMQGFAAIRNLLPDGAELIPWGMPVPIRRGMPMTKEMVGDMERFLEEIGRAMTARELLILLGEGVLCAARDEPSCYMLINAIERAATIRLTMLSAGAG